MEFIEAVIIRELGSSSNKKHREFSDIEGLISRLVQDGINIDASNSTKVIRYSYDLTKPAGNEQRTGYENRPDVSVPIGVTFPHDLSPEVEEFVLRGYNGGDLSIFLTKRVDTWGGSNVYKVLCKVKFNTRLANEVQYGIPIKAQYEDGKIIDRVRESVETFYSESIPEQTLLQIPPK